MSLFSTLGRAQLHSIHVGAVDWEPQGSSNATCAGVASPFAHVHSLISQEVAAMDSCFGLVVTSSARHSLEAEIGLEALCSLPFTSAGTEHSFKRQLHSIHVGAVGWEPHASSNATCAGVASTFAHVHSPGSGSYGQLFWPYCDLISTS